MEPEPRRQRAKSILSFTSSRKRKSSGSFSKSDLIETSKEKAVFRMTSKADPTKAMNEAQPAAVAIEKSTIESIRAIQHRDVNGDIITDPDRSNPTRSRLERPLDTIRSFEAAIDGAYNRRPQSRIGDNDTISPQSRRHSYYQGFTPRQRLQAENGGYYGNRTSSVRADSIIDNYGNSPNPHLNGRRYGPGSRANSDPVLYGHGQNTFPPHNYQQPYDTGGSTSANESHGTDQWGNSTDPSSENSSIDRVQQASKPDLGEVYGFNGFGGAPQFQGPILEEHGQGAPTYGQPGYGQSQMMSGGTYAYQGNGTSKGPPPPTHVSPKEIGPRVPIKLGNSSIKGNTPLAGNTEKRKSWLKRRFSKT